MKQIKKNIRINAPATKVFEYVTNPVNLPEFWPSMVSVSNVERKADGAHSFDWVYKMAGIHFKGHCDTLKIIPNKYAELENKSGIKSLFRWTYEGTNGITELKLELEYDVPLPVLGKVAESFLLKLNEREAETMLFNLRERMEAGEQPHAVAAPTQEKHV